LGPSSFDRVSNLFYTYTTGYQQANARSQLATTNPVIKPNLAIDEVAIMSKAHLHLGASTLSKKPPSGAAPNGRLDPKQPFPSREAPPTKPGQVSEPLFDSVEAARLVRIHPKIVIRMARRGEINGVRFGKLWRFRLSDLQQYVDSHSRSTDAA
jgi:excisionase family DNA binding protein